MNPTPSWLFTDKGDKPEPPARKRESGDTGDGLAQSLGGFLMDNPIAIPILIIATLIGVNYLWAQWRKKQQQRGVAVRPLGPIVRDILRFTLKEDNRVVHKKTPWLTGKRLYLSLAAVSAIGIFPGLPGIPWPIPLLALTVTTWARYSKIARARQNTIMQMFAVAHGECRYPKGAELNPWGYVRVTGWSQLIQPGQTIVTIPAAYQSEDMKTREKFERQFNGTVSEENAWTYKWESAKNRIVCEPAAFLPNMAPYPGPGEKWDEIPVGVKGDGTQAIIPLSTTPHTLVCGPTGSGKSVLQRSILFHVLAHPDTWRIVAIDMKKVEMSFLRKYPSVLKVATDLEEAVEVLRSLRQEMMRRYEEMENEGVNHAKDLPDPPKAILCMIDESTVLLAPEGVKSDEGKERDALHAEAGMIIGELGRLSRASMIHVVACFQRPDATFLKGETKANFDARIAAGRMDTTPSLMVLDSEAANRLPKIKGRGMIRIGGELDTFQGFFAEQSWIDEYLNARAAGGSDGNVPEPQDGPPGEGLDDAVEPPADAVAKGKGPDGQPDGQPGGAGKRRGIRSLAARAAALAQERAARLDEQRATEDAAETDGLAAPQGVPPESPTHGSGDSTASEFSENVPAPPPVEADASVARPAWLDEVMFDEDEEVGDEAEWDEAEWDEDNDVEAPTELSVPESEPPSTVAQPRPSVPQPVNRPVTTLKPGEPLPDYSSPQQAPTPGPRPAGPAGGRSLPVRPPTGLPVRPPGSSGPNV